MVHSTSGFRGTRVGVTQGAGLKNQGDDPLGEPLPRIYVSYWCALGHETRPVFVKLPEEEIPATWDCRRCGRPASRNPGAAPAQETAEDGFKTHLEYVKERRSSQDAEDVLAGALRRLRASRSLPD
ncbi:electron transporter [Arthrobacter sp. Soil736]|uniref:RNA polymerase-binding protein RbpA n=1 Tax=Arthrobacter sp. Soil736 TaxID=1736395 RepID=UPI0006FF141C|nr:RNA polymerase-binding protein RbpA [Arthrobacter sp. Soil736]KRE63952.1 electron transporter [Arthrobacter sp. Soil736]